MSRIRANIGSCKRCGTCCRKGGPVLHREDKEILRVGHMGYGQLVTVRKGEPVFNPLKGRVERVSKEVIKIRGKAKDGSCYFYLEADAACALYEHRFLECRLLKCWDTADIIRVAGRNTISREDIINRGDPVLDVIVAHERECPVEELEDLITASSSGGDRKGIFARLGEMVAKDLSVRSYALSELGLDQAVELFIFGRPLVELLRDRGLTVRMPKGHEFRGTKARIG